MPAVYPDCTKLDGTRGKRGILMETVGRRVEFEWQLIKGTLSPLPFSLAGTSLRRQCRVSTVHLVPLIVLLKLSLANVCPLVHSKCDRICATRNNVVATTCPLVLVTVSLNFVLVCLLTYFTLFILFLILPNVLKRQIFVCVYV